MTGPLQLQLQCWGFKELNIAAEQGKEWQIHPLKLRGSTRLKVLSMQGPWLSKAPLGLRPLHSREQLWLCTPTAPREQRQLEEPLWDMGQSTGLQNYPNSPWQREKQQQQEGRNYTAPMDTDVQMKRNTEVQKKRQNMEKYQDCYLVDLEWRWEGEGWQVQCRGGWLLWRRTWHAQMKSLSGPCSGFTYCPHPEWQSILPCHAIMEDTRLRWRKSTHTKKAILVKTSYHTFS